MAFHRIQMSLSCAQPPSPLSKAQAECIQISPHNCIPHLGLQASRRSSLSLDDSPRYAKLTFDISAFEVILTGAEFYTGNGGLISLANYSTKRQFLKGLKSDMEVLRGKPHFQATQVIFFLSQLKKMQHTSVREEGAPGPGQAL